MADRMERVLEDVAERALVEPSYREILLAVVEHRLSLPDFAAAHARGDLGRLRLQLTDPPLATAVREFEAARTPGRGVRLGLAMLRGLTPPKARLSLLRDPRAVVSLCAAAEAEGRKRNSVRRTLLRSISLLLQFHAGKAERDRVFADVKFAGEDDTREVILSPDEIGRLLKACEGRGELRTVVRLALQTSADRGVLLAGKTAAGQAEGLRVRQVAVFAEGAEGEETYTGEVYLRDRKADSRPRTVPITDALCRELLVLSAGKGPDETVFSMSYSQMDYHWREARKAAGLAHVRFKDLRSQTAIYAERAGVPLTIAAQVLGHGDQSTTRRYQRHQAAMSGDQAGAIERAMGLAA